MVSAECSRNSPVTIAAKEKTSCKEQRGSSVKSAGQEAGESTREHEMMQLGGEKTRGNKTIGYKLVGSAVRAEENEGHEKDGESDINVEKESGASEGARHKRHVEV